MKKQKRVITPREEFNLAVRKASRAFVLPTPQATSFLLTFGTHPIVFPTPDKRTQEDLDGPNNVTL